MIEIGERAPTEQKYYELVVTIGFVDHAGNLRQEQILVHGQAIDQVAVIVGGNDYARLDTSCMDASVGE